MISRRNDLVNDLEHRLQECKVCLQQAKNPTKTDWLSTFKDKNKKIRVAMSKLKDTNDRLTAFNVDHTREWVDGQHVHMEESTAAPLIQPHPDEQVAVLHALPDHLLT